MSNSEFDKLSTTLGTQTIGSVVQVHQCIPSTNLLAYQLAQEGAVDGTIVIAEQQTAGRGRFDRTWHSPEGAGLYLSIILRPNFPTSQAPGVTIMTAVALADTLVGYSPLAVQIKWPNDVLLGGLKIAGILAEVTANQAKMVDSLIVGVGINVNHQAHDFPEELRSIATSLRSVTGSMVNRLDLLTSFLQRFQTEYDLYQADGLAPMIDRVRLYSSLSGRRVRLEIGRRITEGLVVDIDEQGCLVMEIDGRRQVVSSGEVTIAKR